MISLQKLLGKDQRFFDLLEASAEEAKSSASLLSGLVKKTQEQLSPNQLEDFVISRRKDKRITQEITEQLCRTFITPFEREDIEALSNSLYKIPKTVMKISERILICPSELRGQETFQKQVLLLEHATDVVSQMVKELRRGTNLEKIQELNSRLQYVEGEADKLVLQMLRSLYTGQVDAKQVILLKDLYELLERAIDRCRDAGNVVLQVVLKNS